jgi:hypothetical protein
MMLTLASILSSHPWRWSLHLKNLFFSKNWSLRKNLAMTRSKQRIKGDDARMIMCLYGSKWWGISSVWQLSRAVRVCVINADIPFGLFIVHEINFRGGFYVCWPLENIARSYSSRCVEEWLRRQALLKLTDKLIMPYYRDGHFGFSFAMKSFYMVLFQPCILESFFFFVIYKMVFIYLIS